MKNILLSRAVGLLLLAVMVVFSLLLWQKQPQIIASLQSPLPTHTAMPTATPTNTPIPTPCVSQSNAGFVFDFYGYQQHGDNTVTLFYGVTNNNTKDMGYIAFGVPSGKQRKPADGSTYTGKLGDYRVAWTDNNGNPGFPSLRYTTQFNEYKNGASDRFQVTIASFDPTASIQIQTKAANFRGDVTFTPNQAGCEVAPVPTATPQPTVLITTTATTTSTTQPTSQVTPTATPIVVSTACLSQADQGFTFDFVGYQNLGDGTYKLTYQVTNTTNKDISYVAFGTSDWARIQPASSSVFTGTLGGYQVEWTNSNGNPGFPSVKYEAAFSGYNNRAVDTFTIIVSNFDPSKTIQLQAKAGQIRANVSLIPSMGACEILPTPTPTPPVSPLPTPTPTSALTAYHFSEPQVVLTNTDNLVVIDWLPDNKTAVVVADSGESTIESQLIQTFDSEQKKLQTYGRIVPMKSQIVWLQDAQKVAFVSFEDGGVLLRINNETESIIAATGNFRSIAGQGDRVIVLQEGEPSPLLFDANGNALPLPPIDILKEGVNLSEFSATNSYIRWHPTEAKVAIFDRNAFIVLNLDTGETRPYDVGQKTDWWTDGGEWSPTGQAIAVNYVESFPPYTKKQLGILMLATGELELISLPLTYISDMVWSPNGEQLLVAGRDRNLPNILRNDQLEVYLVDVLSKSNLKLTQLSRVFWPFLEYENIAWSSDGSKLLFRCYTGETTDVVGICQSMVNIGGAR